MSDESPYMNEKEFHEHLYDKLWENIIHKENRLWTFLSVYGAAIGLAFGSEILGEYEVEKGIVILILTYWGLELILESDWWSIRNRMMIGGIELQSKGRQGVVPSFYSGPSFSAEVMHDISAFVFAVIGFSVYSFIVVTYKFGNADALLKDICLLSLLYFSVAGTILRIGYRRRQYIIDYYNHFLDLNSVRTEGKKEKDEISVEARKDLRNKSWLGWSIAAYVLCAAVFLWKLDVIIGTGWLVGFGLVHALVIAIFTYYQVKVAPYKLFKDLPGPELKDAAKMTDQEKADAEKKKDEEKDAPRPVSYFLGSIVLLVASALLLINADRKEPDNKALPDVKDLKSKIEKLEESLGKVSESIVRYQTQKEDSVTIKALQSEINELKGKLDKLTDTTKAIVK